MIPDTLQPGAIVTGGPLFDEPVEVLVVQPLGESVRLIGTGRRTNFTHNVVLNQEQLTLLQLSPASEPFDGDAAAQRSPRAIGGISSAMFRSMNRAI